MTPKVCLISHDASPLLTDGEHHRVRQLDVVDADPGDESDEARDDVGVVHVYRLRDGLEAVE